MNLETHHAIRVPLTRPVKISKTDFETLAMPYLKNLYRTAFRLFLDERKASEAVQETYRRARRMWSGFGCETNFRASIFRVLFEIIEQDRCPSLTNVNEPEHPAIDAPVFPERKISLNLQPAELLSAMDRIAQDFREVLLLIDVEEFSYDETGTILNIPVETVKSRITSARTQLFRALA